MAVSRHHIVAQNLFRAFDLLAEGKNEHRAEPLQSAESAERCRIFESQLTSRLIDFEAREMKARGEGFYTIGSAGHEGNACVAAALRPTDMCFLHYRSGAFLLERSKQVPKTTPIFDTLLSLAASSEDPASGGRHKVWGSKALNIPPQTSTIASHLPKALGAAFALDRWAALLREGLIDSHPSMPLDGIVMASFGDASVNHSTALGAINAALWASHQNLPLPLLLVCEDNSVGISVRTPDTWITSQYGGREDLFYVGADGGDIAACLHAARLAANYVREHRAPAFLHIKTIRLMGHAGSDVELSYRSRQEIEATESKDPLIRIARRMVKQGHCSANFPQRLAKQLNERILAASREVVKRDKLTTKAAVTEALAPFDPEAFSRECGREVPSEKRQKIFGGSENLPDARPRKRHMAMLLNWALQDLMLKYPEMILFGEDVAKKGGVYHVTHRLSEKFSVGRVFNTLLDEQSILGLAIGAAHLGYLPCPEIQYLAYLVHAVDQIRGEACSLQFFSNREFANPMVIRVASLGYQKGFGGHFHNDNGFGFLRDIPGLIIACPSRGDDAVGMLRSSFALAKSSGRVVVFMEPIALYMKKDLYEEGDEEWSFAYPKPVEAVEFGAPRIYEPSKAAKPDVLVISYGNGVPMSLAVTQKLAQDKDPIHCRVMDLRWLMPLNKEAIIAAARQVQKVLIVDEGRETAGLGEQLAATLIAEDLDLAIVASADCFIPLAEAANLIMLSEAQIESALRQLVTGDEA